MVNLALIPPMCAICIIENIYWLRQGNMIKCIHLRRIYKVKLQICQKHKVESLLINNYKTLTKASTKQPNYITDLIHMHSQRSRHRYRQTRIQTKTQTHTCTSNHTNARTLWMDFDVFLADMLVGFSSASISYSVHIILLVSGCFCHCNSLLGPAECAKRLNKKT